MTIACFDLVRLFFFAYEVVEFSGKRVTTGNKEQNTKTQAVMKY